MPEPIMNPKTKSEAYDIGFADGQLVSLAVAEECIRLREQNERMERDNARMADQLQRARMLAEQAGVQEGRMMPASGQLFGCEVREVSVPFVLADAPREKAAEVRDGRLALFVILTVAVGLIMVAALARWAR